MANRIRLDRAGIGNILRFQSRPAIERLTAEIARDIEAEHHTVSNGEALPVRTSVIETDRAHGIVVLAHPAGIAMQAKYGLLTRAAGRAGLQVREK